MTALYTDDTGCEKLVYALLAQAVRDAAYGPRRWRLCAQHWLHTPDAADWAEMVGIEVFPPDHRLIRQVRVKHEQYVASHPHFRRQAAYRAQMGMGV